MLYYTMALIQPTIGTVINYKKKADSGQYESAVEGLLQSLPYLRANNIAGMVSCSQLVEIVDVDAYYHEGVYLFYK